MTFYLAPMWPCPGGTMGRAGRSCRLAPKGWRLCRAHHRAAQCPARGVRGAGHILSHVDLRLQENQGRDAIFCHLPLAGNTCFATEQSSFNSLYLNLQICELCTPGKNNSEGNVLCTGAGPVGTKLWPGTLSAFPTNTAKAAAHCLPASQPPSTTFH